MLSCARNTLILVLASLSLQGCFSSEEETKSVEWYLEHENERQAKLEACNNNPGELKDTPNCQNAVRAEVVGSAGAMPTF